MTLTKTQRGRLERQLDFVLARFGERIDYLVVGLSNADAGLQRCELVVHVKQLVKVESSDTDIFLALEHAADRAARSMSRAIETERLLRS